MSRTSKIISLIFIIPLLSGCFSDSPKELRRKADGGDTESMYKLSRYHFDKNQGRGPIFPHREHGSKFCHHLVGEVYWMHRAAKYGHELAKAIIENKVIQYNGLEFYAEDCFIHPDSRIANLMRDKNSQVYKEWNGFCANESCSRKTKNFNEAWYYNGQYIFPSR